MRKNLLVVALFFCFGSILAQNLEGVVTDAVTKKPLKNAILEPEGFSQLFETNAEGKFQLHGLEPGTYILTATPEEGLGYDVKVINNIEVEQGAVTQLEPIILEETSEETTE